MIFVIQFDACFSHGLAFEFEAVVYAWMPLGRSAMIIVPISKHSVPESLEVSRFKRRAARRGNGFDPREATHAIPVIGETVMLNALEVAPSTWRTAISWLFVISPIPLWVCSRNSAKVKTTA
jgi:hypothetical protein